jgi:hypothetical protein
MNISSKSSSNGHNYNCNSLNRESIEEVEKNEKKGLVFHGNQKY